LGLLEASHLVEDSQTHCWKLISPLAGPAGDGHGRSGACKRPQNDSYTDNSACKKNKNKKLFFLNGLLSHFIHFQLQNIAPMCLQIPSNVKVTLGKSFLLL
jgi:hypothetical protein